MRGGRSELTIVGWKILKGCASAAGPLKKKANIYRRTSRGLVTRHDVNRFGVDFVDCKIVCLFYRCRRSKARAVQRGDWLLDWLLDVLLDSRLIWCIFVVFYWFDSIFLDMCNNLIESGFQVWCFSRSSGSQAFPIRLACFLKAFGSQNLGSVRGVSALLIVPVQPIGMILVGTAFDLNLYLESYLLMGAITLIGFAIGSRIIIR